MSINLAKLSLNICWWHYSQYYSQMNLFWNLFWGQSNGSTKDQLWIYFISNISQFLFAVFCETWRKDKVLVVYATFEMFFTFSRLLIIFLYSVVFISFGNFHQNYLNFFFASFNWTFLLLHSAFCMIKSVTVELSTLSVQIRVWTLTHIQRTSGWLQALDELPPTYEQTTPPTRSQKYEIVKIVMMLKETRGWVCYIFIHFHLFHAPLTQNTFNCATEIINSLQLKALAVSHWWYFSLMHSLSISKLLKCNDVNDDKTSKTECSFFNSNFHLYVENMKLLTKKWQKFHWGSSLDFTDG